MATDTAQRPPRILLVDDDALMLRASSDALAGEGYQLETASDGVQAIERVRNNPPDVMVLDVVMPKMNGLEVCRIVKSMSPDVFIPIILVTVQGDVDAKVTGLKLGADDYIAKPYNPLELRARVQSMLRIKGLQEKIVKKRKDLEALSLTDDLTGILNHRAMQLRLKEEFMRAQRYNEPLSLLMIDVDGFRQVNERHGHLFGDFVLQEMAKVLQRSVREIDIVARYGGEEFMVILPQTHFSGSLNVADRIWRGAAAEPFKEGRAQASVTVSIGISFYPTRHVTSMEDLVAAADQALLEAKREGKNRICLHQHLSYMYRPAKKAE